jgi:hypothetical protein
MVESAVIMLSHYMNDKGVHVADEDKGQATLTSFMHCIKLVRDASGRSIRT